MTQPATKKTPASKSSTGFTRISVNLPDDLLAVLDAAATLDNRTRSNFILYSLRCLKQANPFLGEPRSACDKPLSPKTAKGPPGPCPRGHIRPCERNQQPVPKPSPN